MQFGEGKESGGGRGPSLIWYAFVEEMERNLKNMMTLSTLDFSMIPLGFKGKERKKFYKIYTKMTYI